MADMAVVGAGQCVAAAGPQARYLLQVPGLRYAAHPLQRYSEKAQEERDVLPEDVER